MAKAKVKTKTIVSIIALILPICEAGPLININTNFIITKTLLLLNTNSFNLKKNSTYFFINGVAAPPILLIFFIYLD